MNVQCGAPRLCFYRLDVEAELHHDIMLQYCFAFSQFFLPAEG